MASGITDKLRQSYSRVVRPVQKKLQQAELARINYGREQNSGLVGRRLMANPVSYIGAGTTNEMYKAARQGLSSAKNLLPGGKPARVTDVYNVVNTAAMPFTSIPKIAIGGTIGLGMQGVSNKLSGRPFLDKMNYGEQFGKSAAKTPFYTGISWLNPLSQLRPQTTGPIIQRTAQNLFQGAAREGLEGMVEGLTRPLNPGENRGGAMMNDIVFGSLFGAGVEGAGQLGRGVKVIGDKLTIDPNKVIRVKGDSSPVWDEKVGRFRLNGTFYKQLEKTVDYLNEEVEKKIPVKRNGEIVGYITKRQRRWNDQSGFVKPDELIPGSKPQSTVGGVSQTKTQMPKVLPGTQTPNPIPAPIKNTLKTSGSLPVQPSTQLSTPKIAPEIQQSRIQAPIPNSQIKSQPLDAIISEGRKSIGVSKDKPGRNIKQVLDDTYTQWVDRYHPLSKASKRAKTYLKSEGATLRPESDPDYLVRRLTGAGAVADQRFQTKLNPILKEFEASGIQKADMDTYLAHNRMLGFDQAGREIYGVDAAKSKQVVQALEQKYPGIQNIAQKFYQYEDEGLQELAKSGFFSQADIQAMRSQNPNYAPLYRVMDEMDEYLGLPTRKTMQGTSPVKKIKGSKRQILSPVESIIGDTFRQRAAIEKNRVAQSIVNLQKVTDMGFEKVSKSTPETITVWNNGQKEYWRVGREIADVAKGANEEVMNLVLKLAQAPAQLLRQGATGRNPAFMIPNIVRDQLDAGITSKYGYIPFVDYVSGLKSMLKNDEVYQSWQKSGAKIDLGELSGRKSVSKLFNEKAHKKSLTNWLTSGLDTLGKYSEQPTRVGLYKKAFNKTRNPLIAAMESRDATVDFARMGSKMKTANSIIPFLNVGVQGFDKLMRAVKNNPGKVTLNLGMYAAAPATAITLWNLQNHPEEYAEIPQYEKDDNFVIINGRNAEGTVDYFTIPKGNVVPIVANPIQSFLEHLAGVDGKSFKELALSMASDTLPVLETGTTGKEILTKTVGSNMPQFAKPIIEDITNKSFYKYDPKKEAQGRESGVIVPNYLKDKPAYQQTYEFTPQMYQKIGAALNVSPLRVKNMMEGYLAGYAKIPAQVVEMLYASSRGEKISPNDKTVLSRFVKQTYPSSSKAKEKEKVKVPGFMDRMTGKVGAAEEVGLELPTTSKDLSVLYKDAQSTINKYQENKVKSQYGLVDKSLDEYQAEVDAAIKLSKRIEQERPEQVFEIGLETYNKDGGADTKDRTKWAIEQLQKSDDPKSMIQKLYDGQVLTQSVVEELNEKYGLGLTKYNYGDGFRNLPGKGGKGKKTKKTISDAQILSAYKKALEAAYKRPQTKEVRSIRSATKPIKLKRSQVKMLY